MNNRFWCVTVVFNPVGYHSRIDNYKTFKDRLEKQKINLLTVELAFNNQEYTLSADSNTLRLHSHSILWQKERLINYAITQLPKECDRVAWLDCDLLFPFGWDDMLMQKLDKVNFVQLFEKIIHLNPGEKDYGGYRQNSYVGIVWQSKRYAADWIPMRLAKKIGHAEPGFGWGCHRKLLEKGLYDRLIIGGGDNFTCDCLLGSDAIHHYASKLNDHQKTDTAAWRADFTRSGMSTDYLPIDIYHLWHGTIKNRQYETRDLIFKEHNFNPKEDIKVVNNVWEWATDKPKLHTAVFDYFKSRSEDGDKGSL